MKIGIIGGGPSGLSLARLLADRPGVSVTVLEANARLGGNSRTAKLNGTLVEFGTATIGLNSWTLNRWMRQEGIDLIPLAEQNFDGRPLIDYVKSGGGPALALQIPYYLFERYRLMVALSLPNKPHWAVEEAAQPIQAWLQRRKLHKIELFMHRYLTGLGYGFVNQTSTVQALRWVDAGLLATGLLNQEQIPAQGWATFWTRLSRRFHVRLASQVSHIARDGRQCVVTTDAGDRHVFDQIVCAIPIDDFARMTLPTANERAVADAIAWQGIATTLIAATDWFADAWVSSFSSDLLPGATPGRMLSARLEGHDRNIGGFFYMASQTIGGYQVEDLQDMLHGEVRRHGGTIARILETKTFKHFPRYAPDAIRDGLLTRMEQMQGESRTWYTGAAFSHDAVPSILRFNHRLARTIAPRRFLRRRTAEDWETSAWPAATPG